MNAHLIEYEINCRPINGIRVLKAFKIEVNSPEVRGNKKAALPCPVKKEAEKGSH